MTFKPSAEKVKSYNAAFNRRRSLWIASIKESNPCVDCGGYFPAPAMDFDHRDGGALGGGATSVGRRIGSGRWSKAGIVAEMAKCDLVCANCHRVRTWRDRLAQRFIPKWEEKQ